MKKTARKGGLRELLKRFWLFFRDRQWLIIGGLWVVSASLGVWGVTRALAAAGEYRFAWDPFYRALQLFVLEDGALPKGAPLIWQLEVARFLAPTVTTYTALSALALFFSERYQLFRLRFRKGHVVICGLGQMGYQLVREFRDSGEQIVVIEKDSRNDAIRTCRAEGTTVLVGDATDLGILRRARAEHARYLIGACGTDDGANLEMAIQLSRLLASTSTKNKSAIICRFHLVDVRLRGLVRRSRLYTQMDDPVDVRSFNLFENSARALLDKYPPETFAPADLEVPIHVLVVGFGQTGESLVLQLARIGHYAHSRAVQVTVVDQRAKQKEADFLLRYPQLRQICAVRFVEMNVDDAQFMTGAVVRELGRITITFILLDSDARALSCALSLHPHIGNAEIPVVVRMAQDAGLADLLEDEQAWGQAIYPFRMIEDSCKRETILYETQDALAKAIHQAYVEKRLATGGAPATDASMVPWEQLQEDLKDSNRQQADHAVVKLRAIGCTTRQMEEVPTPFSFTAAEVELLASMEHARWNAERFLAGWTLGVRDPAQRISPYLVTWDQLPENIKEYDREAVRNIPALFARVVQQVVRLESEPSSDQRRPIGP